MAYLAPVGLQLIAPDWVDLVPAPAHDSLTPDERRRYLAANPDSYLAVTRSPEDLSSGEAWDAATALARSRSTLKHLVDRGAFGPLASAAFHLYELSEGDHRQVGIVAGVSTEEYDNGRIRIHEQIRTDRAAHLATQLGGLGVQSSPIAVAHRPNPVIAETIEGVIPGAEALVDFRAADGVRQRVWRVDDETIADVLREALADDPLYLIDGHHRAAATSMLRQRLPGTDADLILAAVFSSDDLRTEAFHRLLPGTDGTELLVRLGKRLAVRSARDVDEVIDRGPDELALLIPGRPGAGSWHLVTLPDRPPSGSAADQLLTALEPVRLEQEVLQPLLALDPRPDGARITYQHGRGDRADLNRLQAEATDPVWVMRPVTVDTVMAASDLGVVMPAKSTYFRPKVRSGVFLRPLRIGS